MIQKINVISSYLKTDRYSTEELIGVAFERSFSSSQINYLDFDEYLNTNNGIHVLLNSSTEQAANIFRNLIKGTKNKIILNGKLNHVIQNFLDIKLFSNSFQHEKFYPADSSKSSKSKLRVQYSPNFPYIEPLLDCLNERPLWRYDFEVEWNNKSWGSITDDKEILDLSHNCITNPKNNVAYISNHNGSEIPLISEFTINENILIWINRNLSVVDLPEWKIIENFIAHAYSKKFSCAPYISEFSSKENGLITMRLDCDEEIETARPIYQLYKRNNLPISLAITTNQLENKNKISSLPKEVEDFGGTILNHSHSHPVNWGGTKDLIKSEIETANSLIKKNYDITTQYAVSPFHHLTWEALEVLDELKFKGVVAGISSSHHEFLITKGGSIHKSLEILIHSQQCMLHGDCLTKSRKIDNYLETFFLYYQLGFSTGFLDHPISERYDYGWGNSKRQIDSHKKIIEFLLSHNISFVNEEEIFKRLKAKEQLEITNIEKNNQYLVEIKNKSRFRLSINLACRKLNCEPLSNMSFIVNK